MRPQNNGKRRPIIEFGLEKLAAAGIAPGTADEQKQILKPKLLSRQVRTIEIRQR